jgi:hypothetical protein
VGASSTFFLNLFPQVGLHFEFLNNIRMTFSGGPIFMVTPSPFVFQLQSNGLMGGATIHYFL